MAWPKSNRHVIRLVTTDIQCDDKARLHLDKDRYMSLDLRVANDSTDISESNTSCFNNLEDTSEMKPWSKRGVISNLLVCVGEHHTEARHDGRQAGRKLARITVSHGA